MDLLFKKSEDWIQERLEKNTDSYFCRVEVQEKPVQTGEGSKVLFTDGDAVKAEGRIQEVRDNEVRFAPLEPVFKPLPEDAPGTGYEFVDAEDCGKYTVEFDGKEYGFETFHDLTRGVLKHVPESRNDEDVFCHVVWSRVQDLDLNDVDEYRKRLKRSEILRIRDEIQVLKMAFPPTEPGEIRSRYSSMSKASRVYQGLENYVEQVKRFYAKRREGEIVYELDTSFDFSNGNERLEECKELVRDRVAGRTFPEMRGEEA